MHGERLEPLTGLGAVTRGRFELNRSGHLWTVDADFLGFGDNLSLYRDGALVETAKSPAGFDLGDGATVEANMGIFGMRRIHVVGDGEEEILTPAGGTLEAWRLGLERDRPTLSAAIGVVSWVVLVIALVTGVAELAALAGVDSPLALTGLVATLLGIAAIAAAIERALRFKSNRWLD